MAIESPYRVLESFTRLGIKYATGQDIPEARHWSDLREKQRAGLISWETGREADAKAAEERRLRLAPKPEADEEGDDAEKNDDADEGGDNAQGEGDEEESAEGGGAEGSQRKAKRNPRRKAAA